MSFLIRKKKASILLTPKRKSPNQTEELTFPRSTGRRKKNQSRNKLWNVDIDGEIPFNTPRRESFDEIENTSISDFNKPRTMLMKLKQKAKMNFSFPEISNLALAEKQVKSRRSDAKSSGFDYVSSNISALSRKGEKTFYKSVEASSSCNFLLDDKRVFNLFGARRPLAYESLVAVKTNDNYLNLSSSRIMKLEDGRLKFLKENETVFEVAVHNIRSIKYEGQQNRIFSFTAYKPLQNQSFNGPRIVHSSKKTQIAVQCLDNHEAKRWICFLLLELERFGDLITQILHSLLDITNTKQIKHLKVPHSGCLIKKRVRLYEVALLPDSDKLQKAKYDLGLYLLKNEQQKEAMMLFKQVDDFFERKERQEALNVEEYLEETMAVDALLSIKMELKLKMNLQNSEDEDL